jgi:hypothetical protein
LCGDLFGLVFGQLQLRDELVGRRVDAAEIVAHLEAGHDLALDDHFGQGVGQMPSRP